MIRERSKCGSLSYCIFPATFLKYDALRNLSHALVAQLDRVQPSEGWGQAFESPRARQCDFIPGNGDFYMPKSISINAASKGATFACRMSWPSSETSCFKDRRISLAACNASFSLGLIVFAPPISSH